jgi:hypothetical protein
MTKNNVGNKRNENGMVIIEATFVFPIMFFVLIFLIYMGNAFYMKARIESVVVQKAISGANYCADPLLETMKSTGSFPSLSELSTDPYRYILGGMGGVETKISNEVEAEIMGDSISFFKNMKPDIQTPPSGIAKFNNFVIYSTFSVEVEYVIKFPISFLGESTPPLLTVSSRAEVPVNDTAEFIRNTDMVIDLFHGTKVGQVISDVFGKINKFITDFAGM